MKLYRMGEAKFVEPAQYGACTWLDWSHSNITFEYNLEVILGNLLLLWLSHFLVLQTNGIAGKQLFRFVVVPHLATEGGTPNGHT